MTVDHRERTCGPRIELSPFFTSSPYEPTLPPVTSLDEVDLTDGDLYVHGDPHAAFRLLRQQAPVFWHDRGGASAFGGQPFWAVTTYEGATRVFGDSVAFTGADGQVLDLPKDPLEGFIGLAEGKEHRRWRKAVAPETGPMRIAEHAGRVRETIRATLPEYVTGSTLDVVGLSDALPPAMLSALLELSADEAARIAQLFAWGDFSESSFEGRGAFMNETVDGLIDARSGLPGDDMISVFTRRAAKGDLTQAQLTKYVENIIEAAFVGTRSAVHNPILTLAHHPDQFARLRREPDWIADGRAVEEVLRWAAHAVHGVRRVRVDSEILGQPVKAGDVVGVYFASANRDESVYEDPYVFDVGRRGPRIQSFSVGLHQCLGQYYVRSIVKSLLHELVEHVTTIEQVVPNERFLLGGSTVGSHFTELSVEVDYHPALV